MVSFRVRANLRTSLRAMVRAGLSAAAIGLATSALALETRLSAPQAGEDLQDRLTGASAVMGADINGLDTVQELLAASLSDYNTLVQVLYDAGHFSPNIHIRIDGREAAFIPPLNPPREISKIEITVAPGPAFRFGNARVAPLTPGTELPEGFAPGQPAGTGVLRDAAIAGQRAWRDAGHAKARVGAQNISANHPRAELNADITLIPGPLLRFGDLKTTGDTKVRPDALQRIAGFPTGEVFDP